jgi:predicted RNase H-like HicB family nuclease
MYHDAALQIDGGDFYFRITLGGEERRPKCYYNETKFYIQWGPFEVYRGLFAYAVAIVGKYGAADLMLFHNRSPHPRRVQFVIHIRLRSAWHAIKRKVRGYMFAQICDRIFRANHGTDAGPVEHWLRGQGELTIQLSWDGDGWFARVRELKGCMTQGDTFSEVLWMLDDAIHCWTEVTLEQE